MLNEYSNYHLQYFRSTKLNEITIILLCLKMMFKNKCLAIFLDNIVNTC